MKTEVEKEALCYHCGETCESDSLLFEGKTFCCPGCKLVYEVLSENNLCTYYTLNSAPGNKQESAESKLRFAFLDDSKIADSLISFRSKDAVHVTFNIPSIHCSSCIYLLENFNRINNGVITSRIDFIRKKLSLQFDPAVTSLRRIVETLSSIGYEPSLHLGSTEKTPEKKAGNRYLYKIGVAGFCFGNIMMLSLPDYLSSGTVSEKGMQQFFNYLNLFLALPVFFFSATEFFRNAWNGLRKKTANIDLPISIGIIAMFVRSTIEVTLNLGTGYFDSMAGLVFFMLIGRKFQSFTFDSLAFDRNYKSYFPVAVSRLTGTMESPVSVYDIEVNDRIRIRNREIVPVDGIVIQGEAVADYSFVTGESAPVQIKNGESIFAGARQTRGIIEVLVTKKLSQSYLTQLWNSRQPVQTNTFQKMVHGISRWFIVFTLFIAVSAGLYWYPSDPARALNAFTAVLVIACACALALSAPFTFGNLLRIFGRNKIFLRSNETIESLADIDTIVFDKTGTLTKNSKEGIHFNGEELNDDEKYLVASLLNESSHPLSRRICHYLFLKNQAAVDQFEEVTGQGISGFVNGVKIKAGSASFTGSTDTTASGSRIHISIGNVYRGFFEAGNAYREGIFNLISELREAKYELAVLSGDNASEEKTLRQHFGDSAGLYFHQNPDEKLEYIKQLREKGKKVLMIGDGLNDAGALMQSNVGLTVSDDINNFTPASSGIIDAAMLPRLHQVLKLSRSSIKIIIWSFIISLLYNILGLAFAVQGLLSPVFAAILMPVSTISLVIFTVVSSSLAAKRFQFKN